MTQTGSQPGPQVSEGEPSGFTVAARKSASSWWSRTGEKLFAPVSIESLVFFRIYFGLMMLADLISYFQNGWIRQVYIKPEFHFKYYFFEWVHPWPGAGMYLHFIALSILACCITAGFFYRVSTILFCLGMTYLFLLEQAVYLNHIYLICLVSFLLIFLPCHRACSLDAIRKPGLKSAVTPASAVWLLRFQIGLPYFFGGIAKLHTDWLSGETVRLFFLNESLKGGIRSWMVEDPFVYGISWGGTIFDLLVVPCLLWRPTRIPAFICVLIFHVSNMFLFTIGIFPWLMIGATLIFFPPDWPSRLMGKTGALTVDGSPAKVFSVGSFTRQQKLVLVLGSAFVVLHLLLPFRHWMYPDDASWSEEGHRFSWRMMLRKKITDVRIFLVDEQTKQHVEFDYHRVLTPNQSKKMARSPDMLLQYAHYLKRKLDPDGSRHLGVHVEALVSMNGRKPQLLIDPQVDLTQVQRSMFHQNWIVPLNREASQKWMMERYQTQLSRN